MVAKPLVWFTLRCWTQKWLYVDKHIRDFEKSLLSNYMGDIAQTLHRSLFEPFQIRYVFQYKDVSLHLIVVSIITCCLLMQLLKNGGKDICNWCRKRICVKQLAGAIAPSNCFTHILTDKLHVSLPPFFSSCISRQQVIILTTIRWRLTSL